MLCVCVCVCTWLYCEFTWSLVFLFCVCWCLFILYNACKRGNELLCAQYTSSVYVESVFICLAYNTVCAVPCGAVMLSNRSLRHSLREEKKCFSLHFKVAFTPYDSILFH